MNGANHKLTGISTYPFQLAWWDWSIETITRHLKLIVSGDVAALAAIAPHA